LAKSLTSEMLRLDFVLPRFSRAIWTSDRAREVWEPRFARIANRWREIEWLTVVDGVRPSALLWLSHDELVALVPRLKQYGLSAVPVTSSLRALPGQDRNVLVYRVFIGKGRVLSKERRAWARANDDEIGQCLGYPACCRAFFHWVVVRAGWLDPTWPRAVSAIQSDELKRTLDVQVSPELNLFWQMLGVRLVPHIPCSYSCETSRTLARAFIYTGRRAGYQLELDHALEVMRWPVEWSALHGIAEIKTPIVKLSTRTDATADKLMVRHYGEDYPKEATPGINFPYSTLAVQRPVLLTRKKRSP